MKKQLREELKRFNQIINYNLGGERVIKEDTDVKTEVSFVPAEIDSLIEDLSEVTPISASDHTFDSAALLQAILVDSGYCVHPRTCDYIDGVISAGGTTETSLKDFIDKTSLKNEDLEILENEMVKKAVEEGKSYVGTEERVKEAKKRKDKKFRKMGIHLEYLTPEMAEYFRKWYHHNKKLDVSGDDIEDDMIKYVSKKEGGMADDSRDSASDDNYLPYFYDTKTKILTYKGKNYTLSGDNLAPPTKSKYKVTDSGKRAFNNKEHPKQYNKGTLQYPNSYKSDKWHTNRGVVWKYYKNAMGGATLKNIKNWLNMTDENLYDYYMSMFYDPVKNYSSNELVNHFFAIVGWGSGPHTGPPELRKKILEKTETTTIDEAIEKLGLPVFFDLMVTERGKQFQTYSSFTSHGTGWMNSLINFHYYFYEKYIKPIADTVDDETSEEIINVINNTDAEEEIELVQDLPEVPVIRQGKETWFDLEDFTSKQDTILNNYWGREINIKKGDYIPPSLRKDDDDF